jgi:amino acid permease
MREDLPSGSLSNTAPLVSQPQRTQRADKRSTQSRARIVPHICSQHLLLESDLSTGQAQFIALSGTLGVGLYIQTGAILRLGGPWALWLSVALIALLAWAVMQSLTELLRVWPISGALYESPSVFIDLEVSIAVGVAYWYGTNILEQ